MRPKKLNSNPAQRLHVLLERHKTAVHEYGGAGPSVVWTNILEVPDDVDFLSAYVEAFSLIGQIRQALDVTGDVAYQDMFKIHQNEWRKAFIPNTSGWAQGVSGGTVSDMALNSLHAIASHLRDNLPEGQIPEPEAVASLREEVQAAIDAAIDDDSIPLPVRDLLLRRLHEMLWALDHVAMTGADGIAAACDRLAMAIARASRQPEVPTATLVNRLKNIVVNGYAVVGFADTMYGGFSAWQAIEPYVTEGMKALGS